MSVYSQFGFGDPLGDNFVRQNQDGTATQFFWLADGTITIKEFTDASLAQLIRTIQYNINTDHILDYAFATGEDFAVENIDILGNGDDDKFYNGLNDYIEGNGGNDILYAIDGQNWISGGTGNDYVGASEGHDALFGNADDDRVSGGSGRDFVFGGAGADFVEGNGDDDIASGGAGDDEVRGGTGHDIIIDLDGNNVLYGEAGEDFIIAGAGDDEIHGNEDNDIIYAGGGNDDLHGGFGDDIIFGEEGNDRVFAGTNADVVYGGEGDDYLEGEGGDDILYGEGGADEIKGGSGNDKLYADTPGGAPASDDKLRGGFGDDLLVGGNGRDLLYGDQDNDILAGSSYGQSIMTGGEGADTFAFIGLPGGKAHQIKDFNFAEDKINVSDILEGYDALTDNINDFVRIFFRDTARTDIKINADGEGNDWIAVASVLTDFTGTSPSIMLGLGQLVADQKLFDEV